MKVKGGLPIRGILDGKICGCPHELSLLIAMYQLCCRPQGRIRWTYARLADLEYPPSRTHSKEAKPSNPVSWQTNKRTCSSDFMKIMCRTVFQLSLCHRDFHIKQHSFLFQEIVTKNYWTRRFNDVLGEMYHVTRKTKMPGPIRTKVQINCQADFSQPIKSYTKVW